MITNMNELNDYCKDKEINNSLFPMVVEVDKTFFDDRNHRLSRNHIMTTNMMIDIGMVVCSYTPKYINSSLWKVLND